MTDSQENKWPCWTQKWHKVVLQRKKIILFSKTSLNQDKNVLISNYLLISFSIKCILPSTKDLSLKFLEILPLSFKENNDN